MKNNQIYWIIGIIILAIIILPKLDTGLFSMFSIEEEPIGGAICCKITTIPTNEITHTWTTMNYCNDIGLSLSATTGEIVDNEECQFIIPEKCLFSIGSFCIKLWMLLVGLGAILLIYISTKK